MAISEEVYCLQTQIQRLFICKKDNEDGNKMYISFSEYSLDVIVKIALLDFFLQFFYSISDTNNMVLIVFNDNKSKTN